MHTDNAIRHTLSQPEWFLLSILAFVQVYPLLQQLFGALAHLHAQGDAIYKHIYMLKAMLHTSTHVYVTVGVHIFMPSNSYLHAEIDQA